jgi:hypothetical protein
VRRSTCRTTESDPNPNVHVNNHRVYSERPGRRRLRATL